MEMSCQLHVPAALLLGKQSPVLTGWAPEPEEDIAPTRNRILCRSACPYIGYPVPTLVKDRREYKLAEWPTFLFTVTKSSFSAKLLKGVFCMGAKLGL
jgi:hypothetical protein